MAIDNYGGGDRFSRHAEEDRSDVTSGGGDSRHPKGEGKSLHRGHCEKEKKHQSQRDRPAKAWQESPHETSGNPHQLEDKNLPSKELDKAGKRGIEDNNHSRISGGVRGNRRAPQKLDRWPPLHFFLTPGDQKLCQFGPEFRIQLVKPGHRLCYSGAINWIDVHL